MSEITDITTLIGREHLFNKRYIPNFDLLLSRSMCAREVISIVVMLQKEWSIVCQRVLLAEYTPNLVFPLLVGIVELLFFYVCKL